VATVTEIDPTGKLTCTAALGQAYQLAVEKLPADTHGRLALALELVQNGGVFESDAGHWEVLSQSEPGKTYAVNGSCPCEWAHFHPGNRCTHQLAVLLQRKTMALMAAPQVEEAPELVPGTEPDSALEPVVVSPAVPLAPLPEAACSVNCHVMVAGRQVQVTLRGTSEVEVLGRLEQVLRQYPDVPPQSGKKAMPRAGETPGTGEEGWCPVHATQMRWNDGKEGRKGWYSHRAPDGSWCKGR
jgi:hypothetical protein